MPKKSNEPRPGEKIVALQVRLREDLRAKLAEKAESSGRPMNAEIIQLLSRALEYDSLYTDHLRPVLGAIAFNAWRVEQRTGKKWNDDRATALAMAVVAGESFRYGVPMANHEELIAAMDRLNDLRTIADRKIGYLLDVGAVEESPQRNALAGLFGRQNALAALAAPHELGLLGFVVPEDWRPSVEILRRLHYRAKVDFTQFPSDWSLQRDGEDLEQAEKIGVAATLKSIGAMMEDFDHANHTFEIAYKPEHDARKAAEQVVAELHGGGNVA